MKVTIVGVRKFESKGKKAFNYHGLKDFTYYDLENSECEGNPVVTEFSYTDYNLHVGDIVEFDYEPGFQGRASLVGVRPISEVEQPKSSGTSTEKKDAESSASGTEKKETK